VIHACPALGDLSRLSPGRVRAKRAASQGGDGAAGPAGPPGPSASGRAIRVIAKPCDQAACGASCEENEQILSAYALNPGGAIGFIDERNVTFRPKERPAVLVLACIGK
jgi:hypothetical protein